MKALGQPEDRKGSSRLASRRAFLGLATRMAGLATAGAMFGGRWPAPPSLWPDATEGSERLFDKLMAPFLNETGKRRAQRQATEAGFFRRVDAELNDGRVNFLLFGQGETFEPPFEKVGIIGSHTILSYDTRRRVADLVSITHDTRAPEIERALKQTGFYPDMYPIKIDQAFNLGTRAGGKAEAGFDLMRRVLESATGLSVDFQLVFWDDAIVDLVNSVFGKVKVNVPKPFTANRFFFKGKGYPQAEFLAGEQELDGLQAIQFIKTVVVEETEYPDPDLEHNARKHLLFRSMFDQWRAMDNPLQRSVFLGKMLLYVTGSVRNNTITYDFDSTALLANNIRAVAEGLKAFVSGGSDQGVEPEVGRTLYIVDRRHGDGGVRWVKGNDEPIIKSEFESGLYVDQNMEVAVGGDPYAEDLVSGYWPAVRAVVKNGLMPAAPTG